MSYVYAIGAIRNDRIESVKIGVAGEPLKRLATLQTGNHYKLRILFAFDTERADWVYEFEKSLHTTLARYKMTGEWFSCENNNVLKFVSAIFQDRSNGHSLNWQPSAFYDDGAV